MSNNSFIYLASQSPRRRDLLKQLGINFRLLMIRDDPRRKPDVDETPYPDEAALDYVQRICRTKAEAAWESVRYRNLQQAPLLAADTTVVLENKIIGKPRDRKDAEKILHLLSGRQHRVLTAVAVILDDRLELRLSETLVTFTELSDKRIHHYLLNSEAHDKAGAYGIQGIAAAFVQRIEGSYSGVMGLPLFETAELLNSFGYPAP